MNKRNLKLTLIIIAFAIGVFTVRHFIAGAFLAFATFIIVNTIDFGRAQSKKNSKPQNDTFAQALLLLSAVVIKADRRIYKKELNLVRIKLEHDFGKHAAEKYMQDLQLCLKKKVNVEAVCKRIRITMDRPTKVQLLHFLTGLTVTNRIMIDYEYDLLRKIAFECKIPERSFNSILSMFNFKRERSYSKQKAKQKSYSKPIRVSSLNRAYRILEISENVTDAQVKKAYRKLAKIHHPDRVVHLGGEFQKNAKIKFQKISDAYELIKSKRNFN